MPFLMTPEENFLWEAARYWRSPDKIMVPDSLDWSRIAEVGVANRMATLLKRILDATGGWRDLPDGAQKEIQDSAERLSQNAVVMSQSLSTYLKYAHARAIRTVVLKGLSISNNIYGDPAMRPGGDIDILVSRPQVNAAIELLEEMDIGPYWPNLMADPYYERHHLHHQRCSRDLKIWFEIHWALDHPYTLLTIDYDAVLNRAKPARLLGQSVYELDLPDLLLTLVVHLVKHAVYLPTAVHKEDLARVILADGMLMYYLDIAEVIQKYNTEIDWNAVIRLARSTGTTGLFGPVLRAVNITLSAGVPNTVIEALSLEEPGRVTKFAMNRVIEREIAQYSGGAPSRFWEVLLVTNGAFILRPIRIIESARYFFPHKDFMFRRYGRHDAGTMLVHFVRAVLQFSRFGIDSIYFALERYRRLKKIGYSTSLFNRLEPDG